MQEERIEARGLGEDSSSGYQDGDGRSTGRVIQPFAVAYYTGATLICAWCELRNDVRHFRTDRVVTADVLAKIGANRHLISVERGR